MHPQLGAVCNDHSPEELEFYAKRLSGLKLDDTLDHEKEFE